MEQYRLCCSICSLISVNMSLPGYLMLTELEVYVRRTLFLNRICIILWFSGFKLFMPLPVDSKEASA